MNLWGYARRNQERAETAVATKAEALKILDKDSLNLGDINPLIHSVKLDSRESVDAVRLTILEKIEKFAPHIMPSILESTHVTDPISGNSDLRFIARFEVPELTEPQIVLLEELVQQTYGLTVRTRKDSKGNDLPTESYPPAQPGEEAWSKTGGWYMGPNMNSTSSLHVGLFVFKDLGQVNKKNFLATSQETPAKYIVEIREAGQYQTDLVAFVCQVASILEHERMIDQGELLYEIYYDLMRLGLKKVNRESIYGMDMIISLIKRGLLTPLASPDLSHGIKEDPESVLMIGVPGTGKTLVVEELLNEDTGIFIVPLDPLELQKDLLQDKNAQKLLPRISQVARITSRPVVLHIDDIENIMGEDQYTHSTLLNLMAGVKESGFYVIASTNKPEKIDEALLQPQRFGILLHCGLQNEEARFEILKIHAKLESERLKRPLFHSDKVRDIILRRVAQKTESFTPRYLASITRSAKSFLTERVANQTGTNINLAEEHLDGHYFQLSDWDNAFREVAAHYDKKAVKRRDEELKNFANKHSSVALGFLGSGGPESESIFGVEIQDQIDALIAIAMANQSGSEPKQ